MANNSLKNTIESEDIKRLSTLIEALTHSGANTLEDDMFKEVKKICKSSQTHIPKAYNLILKQLKKKNSQIRLIAFLMCKELFKRSAIFREHLLKDLKLIFELSAEINSAKKLPPPKSSAKSLKTIAISTLKTWVEEYGETYKKLKVAFNYFQNCKKVDFDLLQVRNSTDCIRENEQQNHLRATQNERMRKLNEDINGNKSDIQLTVTSLSNCLNLLLPPLEDFFIPDYILKNKVPEAENKISVQKTVGSLEKGGEILNMMEGVCDNHSHNNVNSNGSDDIHDINGEKNEYDLRQFGITSNYNLSLEVNPDSKINVVQNEENSSIIENVKDLAKLIYNKYLPMVKKWARICSINSDRNNYELKKVLDLKEELDTVLRKYNRLVFEGMEISETATQDDSSDDEFEEVKKEGYEESVNFPDDNLVQMDCFIQNESNQIKGDHLNLPSSDSVIKDKLGQPLPSTSKVSGCVTENTDRKTKLMAIAPKLPYDIDLYHWEDEDLKPPTLLSTKIDVDKFWGSCGSDDIHEIPNPEGMAALRTRVIEFTGTFEPVKWSCRAPLPNGKLCPRKDRFKCPFHGKIVPRDEIGKCRNKEDETLNLNNLESPSSSWQDPQLIGDIKAATGIDLGIPGKRGLRKKCEKKNLTHKKMRTSSKALRMVGEKKLPGLVDVVRKQNNSYSRLSKKIFNRSSLKRVSSALNKIDRNKYQDKFGDQFNYT